MNPTTKDKKDLSCRGMGSPLHGRGKFDESMRISEVVVTDVDGHPRFSDPESGIKWWMAQFNVMNDSPGALQNLDRAVYRPSALPGRELVIKDQQGACEWRDRRKVVPVNDEIVSSDTTFYTGRYVQQLGANVSLELTTLDAFYVVMRSLTVGRALKKKMKDYFTPSMFDHYFRDYMTYLLESGTVYGLDMGWEDVTNLIYRVSIKPTPVPESWDVRLHLGESDLDKFATTRYKNSAGVCQDYAPVQYLVRFREQTFFDTIHKLDAILDETNKTTDVKCSKTTENRASTPARSDRSEK